MSLSGSLSEIALLDVLSVADGLLLTHVSGLVLVVNVLLEELLAELVALDDGRVAVCAKRARTV